MTPKLAIAMRKRMRASSSAVLLIAAICLLQPSAGQTAQVDEPPTDPDAFTAYVATKLQSAMPGQVAKATQGGLILIQTRGHESNAIIGVDRSRLCTQTTSDCSEAVREFVAQTASTYAPRTGTREKVASQPSLSRAVFADRRLWLLSDAGALSSVVEGGRDATSETLPDPVSGLCAQNGHALVATCPRDGCNEWTVRRRANEQWQAATRVKRENEKLINLSCDVEGTTLLTTRRVIEVSGGRQTAVVLSETLDPGLTAAVYSSGNTMFVGLNNGEFGGGLRRIDRGTGIVTAIEQKDSRDPCGGPLNAACDPVTGIAEEPWNPGCIAAAIGLVHMSTHGRIVEVCGDAVRRLYFKSYGQPARRVDSGSVESAGTVAFFGLMQVGNRLLAVSTDGLYRIDRNGTAELLPLPSFKRIGGISVSFDLRDAVLVLTNINGRASVNGAVPILVPR